MIIQLLLVPALVAAVVLSLRSRVSLRGQARRKIVAALTAVAGVVAVLFPGTLQALADAVGVTRGTDLLLYVLVVVLIYLVGSTSARFREQESRLVQLSRQIALYDAALRRVEQQRTPLQPLALVAPLRSEQPADQGPVAGEGGVQESATAR